VTQKIRRPTVPAAEWKLGVSATTLNLQPLPKAAKRIAQTSDQRVAAQPFAACGSDYSRFTKFSIPLPAPSGGGFFASLLCHLSVIQDR